MAKKLSYVISCALSLFMYALISAVDESSLGIHSGCMPSFYFVRHGQTDWNAGNRVPGITDYTLNAVGKQQVEELRVQMMDITFSTCYASDLKRTSETASILTHNHLPIIPDIRLREREYAIEKKEDFAQRVTAFLQDLTHKKLKDSVLVVSHAGCMRIMLEHMLQLSLPEDRQIAVYNAAYFKAYLCDDQWKICKMQDIHVPKVDD